ncbi:MAG: glutaminyl-peptide cyclotransferase [Variibacter sp.]
MFKPRHWMLAAALASFSPLAQAQDCPAPKTLLFHVESQIERDTLGFTQGLEVHDGKLVESTGPIDGETRLNTIDRKGRVTPIAKFGQSFFGEGLTILGDEMFQLSWKDHKVFVYDLAGKRLREMPSTHDGWGLTNDGTSLIFTDGGDRLYFADPQTFKIIRNVQIRLGDKPVPALNELEWVDGKIYANVFTTKAIVRVIPETGCIDATADLSKVLWPRMSLNERERLLSSDNYVLNGIAYDKRDGTFLLTGKRWRWIFVGKFTPAD